MGTVDAAIVGAGPNGLSIAAHLRARGVGFRIFGEPMKTWLPMPRNLSLKSLGFATSIALPEEGATLPGWLAERNLETLEPISYADFTEYGLSVQRRFVPEVEPVNVTMLEPGPEGDHALTLATGERVRARSVIVAIGLNYLQRKPAELSDLPAELVSHTFGQYDFSAYAGKAVAVIGAGQSALEAAVLLHEAAARPVVISREPPFFYERTPVERSLLDRVRNPLTVFGAGRMHWVLEHFPGLLRHAPEQKRVRFTQRYLGPSGAWWLRDRFEGKVRVVSPVRLLSAREEGGEVVLRLRHGAGGEREERVAHVVCGSGFEYDVHRLPFLNRNLVQKLQLIQGRAPRLSGHFESSAPGLYFVGPLAAYSFGPLVRFVCGSRYTAPRVARHVDRRRGFFTSRLRGPVASPRSGAPAG